MYAKVTLVDGKGQHQKKNAFYLRSGNGTREVTDEAEIQERIASHWGKG